MVCQDFERYAIEKPMNGLVADKYKEFFFKRIDYRNEELRVLNFGCGDGNIRTSLESSSKKRTFLG